ncbi:hypothetical protein NKI91_26060 [Mesorhizobium sp. M0312]|uniref:hypothetical protein n=1 Tax=Mesorhizobium sp. M0312 TaxID=2956934 RepID=UPI003337FB1D
MNKVADKLLDMALNSLFSTARAGGIFGAIGALFGFSSGGVVQHLAGGGHVRGAGTATSDSISGHAVRWRVCRERPCESAR